MKFNRKAIATLANRLFKTGRYTLSEAFKAAWLVAKLDRIRLVTFTKKSGETTTRVVSTSYSEYQDFKGTRRVKEGLKLFVDLEKVFKGVKNAIISAYESSIISFV